jgi:hypothetical protein
LPLVVKKNLGKLDNKQPEQVIDECQGHGSISFESKEHREKFLKDYKDGLFNEEI